MPRRMRELARRALRRAPIIRPLWDEYERLLKERDALLVERGAEQGGTVDLNRFAAQCKRLLDGPAERRGALEDRGVVVLPADFNAPVPLLRDLTRSFEGVAGDRPLYDRIFDRATIADAFTAMLPFAGEFDPPLAGDEQTATEFFWGNTHFSFVDAMAYHCLVRHWRPRRIVEIGSGSSTLVADAALRRNGSGDIVCIDPYIRPSIAGLATVTRALRAPVETVALDELSALVDAADILFIDGTHTVKIGSDCVYLYLVLLPTIEKRLIVHSHDVFLPFGMPPHWARDRQMYWNEQYLLYAWLLDNPRARVVFGSSYAAHALPAETAALMAGKAAPGGCSLWYEINPAR